MNYSGKYTPGHSVLHNMDPKGKFFGFLFLIAAVCLADAWAGFGLLFGLVLVLALAADIKLDLIAGTILPLRWFFLIIFVLNALFSQSSNPLYHLGIINLSMDGILQGARILIRLFLVLVTANALTRTTPPMALMQGMHDLISPLRFVKVPVDQVAMILSVSIQFIPTLMDEADTIKKAQIARGARFESPRMIHRIMALFPLLLPVFLSAFRRADELSVAMEARGYRGEKGRTRKEKKPLTKSGWQIIASCAAVCVLVYML